MVQFEPDDALGDSVGAAAHSRRPGHQFRRGLQNRVPDLLDDPLQLVHVVGDPHGHRVLGRRTLGAAQVLPRARPIANNCCKTSSCRSRSCSAS